MAYYLKQYKAQNGVESQRFYTFDRCLTGVFSDRVANFKSFHEAQYYLTFAKRKFGGWWEIRSKNGMNDHSVLRMEEKPTLHEIERNVMTGRHVSASDLNRFARSPRGMMLLEMMRK